MSIFDVMESIEFTVVYITDAIEQGIWLICVTAVVCTAMKAYNGKP